MKISFFIENSSSLKEKRRVLKSIIDRTKNRFNVSVSEVEDNALLQKGTIGVALVSNNTEFANSQLSHVSNYVDELGMAQIINTELEIIHV